jgi:hypothetical protein
MFVRKNRDGKQGVIKITHNESLTAFYDYDYSRADTGRYASPPHPDRFHDSAGGQEIPF